MRVISHELCLKHDPGIGHPEHAGRLRAALDGVQALGLAVEVSQPATQDQLERVHSHGLVQSLLEQRGQNFRIDADTALSADSIDAALFAAGSGITALNGLSVVPRAFCAVRPPGHHATRTQAMGFCLFNNVAVAAAEAIAQGFQRIAIVDFDVHHGNGTQDIFWNEAKVHYYSTHQSPLYPGTGADDETGAYANIHNLGLAPGTGSEVFRAAWCQLLPRLAQQRPELLLISAGFDAHYLDPLASLRLSEDDFAWLTSSLLETTAFSSQGRCISFLEGGYSPAALTACTKAHVGAMMDRSITAR
jgi:acetoin utilization deacetylase AcuC-like enzyme